MEYATVGPVTVTSLTLLQLGIFLESALRVLSHRILFAAISFYYHHVIGEKGSASVKPKLIKSSSAKDLTSKDSLNLNSIAKDTAAKKTE